MCTILKPVTKMSLKITRELKRTVHKSFETTDNGLNVCVYVCLSMHT